MGGGGCGGGGIAPRSQRNVRKNGGFTFFMPSTKIYPVIMSIQIHARGVRIFFFIKMVQYVHSERSQIRYYQR